MCIYSKVDLVIVLTYDKKEAVSSGMMEKTTVPRENRPFANELTRIVLMDFDVDDKKCCYSIPERNKPSNMPLVILTTFRSLGHQNTVYLWREPIVVK